MNENKRRDLAKALKTLDTAPKEIDKAKAEYRAKMDEIRQHEASRQWSPASIDRMKAEAKAKRDRNISGLADGMINAYNYVATNNNYTGTDLDLDDPKFNKAITLISVLGDKMPYDTQVSVLNQFRGNTAALAVLEEAYKKNHLYAASMAHDMQRPISSQAMENMARTLNTYVYKRDYKGVIDFDIDEHSHWTKNAFGQQAQRLGLDMDSASDPYEFALEQMRSGLEEDMFNGKASTNSQALQWRLDLAKQEIARAKANGEDVASVFNAAMKRVEDFKSGEEAKAAAAAASAAAAE
jgi:hypothetical protein